MARCNPLVSSFRVWVAGVGAVGGCGPGDHARSASVPSPTDSSQLAAKCDRTWGGAARIPLRHLHHSQSRRLNATGPNSGRRHWSDRSGPCIAFRDITENFLASIFLSMHRPFETGDLIEVSGVTGYVQQLNVRTTILMNLDGNLVQIPNATVYKSTLRNFTTNCNRREDFDVGIGYDDSINEAQEIARNVLANHPAVLNDPEPSVLVDSLGKATVNLRVYFWLNGREHSWLKVRSSVIRLVKRAFQQHGISMPDEAREVVFPQGIPVTVLDRKPDEQAGAKEGERRSAESSQEQYDTVSTQAEGGLYSEAGVIEAQARQAQPLKDRENLLKVPIRLCFLR